MLIDPGHDFGKNTWHSLEVTRRLGELVETGWPVLVSLSNKDFVGETLDRPVAERLTGTLATTAVCGLAGSAGVPRAQRRARRGTRSTWSRRSAAPAARADPPRPRLSRPTIPAEIFAAATTTACRGPKWS